MPIPCFPEAKQKGLDHKRRHRRLLYTTQVHPWLDCGCSVTDPPVVGLTASAPIGLSADIPLNMNEEQRRRMLYFKTYHSELFRSDDDPIIEYAAQDITVTKI